jgi:hypothetical protein
VQIYGNRVLPAKNNRQILKVNNPMAIGSVNSPFYRQAGANFRQLQISPSYLYVMKFVLYAILAYIAYQFIFKLVIPVYLASRKIKKGFREMHSKMQEHMQQQQGYTPQPSSSKTAPTTKAADYIDFEELK